MSAPGYLVVQSGAEQYGLPLDGVMEIVDVREVLAVPARHPAVRGVVPVGARLVPLIHLGRLLDPAASPSDGPPANAVVVQAGRHHLALEVDTTPAVVGAPPLPVPPAWRRAWVRAVARHGGTILPVVDLDTLASRLEPEATDDVT